MEFAADEFVYTSTETLYQPKMVQKRLNEQAKLLELPNKYHRAPSLLKTVPVLSASYYSHEHTRQEFEFIPLANYLVPTQSAQLASTRVAMANSCGGVRAEVQIGLQVQLVVSNAFNTSENMPGAFETTLAR